MLTGAGFLNHQQYDEELTMVGKNPSFLAGGRH